MKKTKLIALTMVIAMMLVVQDMLHGQTTEINATVATGELDVNVGYSNITAPHILMPRLLVDGVVTTEEIIIK